MPRTTQRDALRNATGFIANLLRAGAGERGTKRWTPDWAGHREEISTVPLIRAVALAADPKDQPMRSYARLTDCPIRVPDRPDSPVAEQLVAPRRPRALGLDRACERIRPGSSPRKRSQEYVLERSTRIASVDRKVSRIYGHYLIEPFLLSKPNQGNIGKIRWKIAILGQQGGYSRKIVHPHKSKKPGIHASLKPSKRRCLMRRTGGQHVRDLRRYRLGAPELPAKALEKLDGQLVVSIRPVDQRHHRAGIKQRVCHANARS